jgi:hypothetical protein
MHRWHHPLNQIITYYFFVCDNTEPAKLLATLLDEGLNNTLDAFDARDFDDCLVLIFFLAIINSPHFQYGVLQIYLHTTYCTLYG